MADPGVNSSSFDPSQVASHRCNPLQYISVDSYRVESWRYHGFPCHVRAGSVRVEPIDLTLSRRLTLSKQTYYPYCWCIYSKKYYNNIRHANQYEQAVKTDSTSFFR